MRALAQQSLATILAGQDPSGAYVASPTFAHYRYGWLRDGAFCALAASRAGRPDSAEAFFSWAAHAVVGQSDRVRRAVAAGPTAPIDGDYLPARYALDGSRLDDGWWDRQHDGYGTWLWVMADHQRRHGPVDPTPELIEGVRLTVEYLTACWPRACYDWWEENDGHSHTATLAAVAAGLAAVVDWPWLPAPQRSQAAETATAIRSAILARAVHDGHLVKWLDDSTAVDASLIACGTPLRVFAPNDPLMVSTVAQIERDLVTDGAGVHRHLADTFYGGGAWPLLSALLGMYYVDCGRVADATRQLGWTLAQATPAGHLPEQVPQRLLHPEARAEWLERWEEPACPLLWAHAMYLMLALDLASSDEPPRDAPEPG